MADRRIFLDWNAGAPLRPQAREAMAAVLDEVGNPSSVHAEGRRARRLVEDARERLATLVRARPADIVFTAGATEAANTVLTPAAPRHQNPKPLTRLLLGASEHVAVLQGHRFGSDAVELVPIDAGGVIDPGALESRVAELTAEHGIASVMVALQAANNETGVVQPLAEVTRRLDPLGAIVVCDAAQIAGKLPFDAVSIGADVTILSAHKFGGPKGVGAIVYGADHVRPEPLLRGGGQEGRRRAGTENVPAIVGFAAAAEIAWQEVAAFAARAAMLRDGLEADLLAATPNAVIYGERSPRLPNTTLIGVPRVSAETLVIALDLAGAAVSSGAACSSGKVGPSHVLAAMGVDSIQARSAIRISIGWETTAEDLHRFGALWRGVMARIRPNALSRTA